MSDKIFLSVLKFSETDVKRSVIDLGSTLNRNSDEGDFFLLLTTKSYLSLQVTSFKKNRPFSYLMFLFLLQS